MANSVKTYVVAQDVREEVLSLFGTVANAQAKLRIDLSYAGLNEALRGMAVRPADGEGLEQAWREWKQHFLRGVAIGVQTDLNNFERPQPVDTEELEAREAEEWRRRLKRSQT